MPRSTARSQGTPDGSGVEPGPVTGYLSTVSQAVREERKVVTALFADNLRRFESGQPLMNVVDKAEGY